METGDGERPESDCTLGEQKQQTSRKENASEFQERMHNLEVTCSICDKQYSEDKTPRNLPCGHTMCTLCVDQILAKDQKCPECRVHIAASASSDLPVGYTLLRMALSLNKKFLEKPQRKQCLEEKCTAHQADAGMCDVHGSRLFFRCQTCDAWVCRDCLAVDHPEPPKGSCRIVSFSNALAEAKETYTKTKCSEKMLITFMKDELSAVKSHLLLKEEEHREKVNALKEQMNYIKHKTDEITMLITKLESCPDSLKVVEDCLAQAHTPKELISAAQAATNSSNYLKRIVKEVEKILKQFPPGITSGVSVSNLMHANVEIFKSVLSHDSKEIEGAKSSCFSFSVKSPPGSLPTSQAFGFPSTFGSSKCGTTGLFHVGNPSTFGGSKF